MTAAALIVAAGRGARAGRDGLSPKQYAPLAGRTVLAHAIAAGIGGCTLDYPDWADDFR